MTLVLTRTSCLGDTAIRFFDILLATVPREKATYKIRSEIWIYPGQAAWHFIYVPRKESADIKKRFGANARGWGSLPVSVVIGKTTWKTSIFPDKKSEMYLLPVKAEVRKKEEILAGDMISFILRLI